MLEVMDSAAMAAKPHAFVDAPVSRRTDGAMDAHAVRRPRKVHIYCNGDRFFRGKLVHLNLNRYRNFNDLLNDLTGKLPNTMHLTYGVRQIFTPVTGRKIRDISQMQDGQDYVCAGFETFKPMKYGSDAVTESWSFGRSRVGGVAVGGGGGGMEPFGDTKSSPPSFGGPNAFHPQRHIRPKPLTGQKFATLRPGIWSIHASTDSFSKPKVITIFRSGVRPCPNVKILLNRHGVQSLDQVLRDVSEAFGPKWTGSRLQKIYSVRGREVNSTGDFFRGDDIFIAVGGDDPTLSEVTEILDQLYPDSPYADLMLRKWEHAKRRRNRQAGHRKEAFLERGVESKAGMGGEDGGGSRRRDQEDAHEKETERLNDRETARQMDDEQLGGDDSAEEAKEAVSGRNTRTDGSNRLRRSQLTTKQKRKKVCDCEVSQQSQQQELEKERDSENGREKEREKEIGRMDEQLRQRQKELKKERQKQKEEEEDRERVDMDGTKEQDKERQRQRDKGNESKMEKEKEQRERKREKEKEREIEMEKERDREKEREKEKEREIDKEREKEREMERAREKEKERELEREKEGQIQRRRKPQVRLKPIHEPSGKGNASRDRHDKDDGHFDSNREENTRLRYIRKDDLLSPQNKGSLRDLVTVEPITSPGRKVVKGGEDSGRRHEESGKDAQKSDDSQQKSSDDDDDLERTDARRSNTNEFRILSSHSRKNETLKGNFRTDENKADDSKATADDERQSKVLQNGLAETDGEKKESAPPGDTGRVPPRKKRSKPIIYKSKMERQISNTEHVTEKYELGKVLGDGNFAVVRQCQHRPSSREYAMKVIDKSKLRGKESMIENEIALMKACDHPNIVKLYEEYETKTEIYLVMELVKGGDLFDAITQSVKFNEVDTSKMVFDLAQALYYLHSRGVVHRDLKPENILVHQGVGGERSLKLADFGLALEVNDLIYTVCGTPTYVAPEILSEIGYGLEIDMWALGVITYILLCGFPPFRSADRKQTELFEFIKSGEFEFLSPYWDNNSNSAKSLINRLLVVDRKKRYSAVDVLCDPFVVTFAGSKPEPDLRLITTNLRHKLDQQGRRNREQFRLQMMKRRL